MQDRTHSVWRWVRRGTDHMETAGWGNASAMIHRAGGRATHDISEDLRPIGWGGDAQRRWLELELFDAGIEGGGLRRGSLS
jgi:hypothetical protein